VSLWAILLLKTGTNVITPHRENTLSLWISLSLNHNHTSLHPKLLFKGRVRLKMIFLTLLPIPTPMPELEQQQLINESPTEPTDKPYALPVEKLRVYSRRQKNKTIPDATCQTSNPGSGNATCILI